MLGARLNRDKTREYNYHDSVWDPFFTNSSSSRGYIMFYARELARFFALLFDSAGECKLKDNMTFEAAGISATCIN